MRGDAQEVGALANRLAHAPQLGPLQVPNPPVDDLEAVGGRRGAEIRLFDQGHGEAPQRGVPGGEGALNTAPDHEQVEPSVAQYCEVPFHDVVSSEGPADRRPARPRAVRTRSQVHATRASPTYEA